MRDGFHHCAVMYCDAENKSSSIIVDFGINKIGINIYSFDQTLKMIKDYEAIGGTVLFGKIKPGNIMATRTPFNFEPINCTTIVKRFLGIKHRFVWTPYRLYKLLTNKYNFEVVTVGGNSDPNKAFDDEQEYLTKQLQRESQASNTRLETNRLQLEQRMQGGSGFYAGDNSKVG